MVIDNTYYGNHAVRNTTRGLRLYNEVGYIDIQDDSVSYYYMVRDYLGSIRAIVGPGGTLEQATDYTVTGIPYTATTDQSGNRRLHTGKELHTFNGLYHYDNHARIYDPLTGRFTTLDPLAGQYPSLSPYNHCANNPLILIDPDGLSATLLGSEKNKAFSQLQEYVKKDLTLSINDDGQLTYEKNHSRILRVESTDIMRVIDDRNITVNVTATSETFTSTGNFFVGGAFMGNEVKTTSDGDVVVSAFQEVNPNILGAADAVTETPGKMMAHEFTEAYEGGLISQKKGEWSPPANMNGTVYIDAHKRASPQITILRFLYNEEGKIVNNIYNATRAEWIINKGHKYHIIQTYP